MLVFIDGILDWWLDLLYLYTQLVSAGNTVLSLISTLYNSLLHPLVSSVYYSLH
jgi:hypothetical protein